MDELRQKFKRGKIDKKTYQEKLTELTILHLEAIDYKYVGKIADGVHGVVVEMKSPKTALNVAVKIVFEDLEPGSGVISWPKIIHENILPLLTWRVIKEANSKVFITMKYDKTLQDKISSFRYDSNGFEKAASCIKDITNGINYLHHQGLCHLNLSPDRIFMENNKAILGGFGYLTSKETQDPKFGATAVFRPPETFRWIYRSIEGQKFDVWSLGVLAIETLTGQYLSKEIAKWSDSPETWHIQVYELMYSVLEKENFKDLVMKHFRNWTADDDKLDQALSFIQSCLTYNLEDRPSTDDLLKHRFLGGHVEKYRCPTEEPDIWAKKVSAGELVLLTLKKKNSNLDESDNDTSDDEDSDTEEEHLNESNVLERDIKNKFSLEGDKEEKDFEILMQKFKHLNDVKEKKEEMEIKENDIPKESAVNNKDVKEPKSEIDKNNEKVNVEEKPNAMKKMIEDIDIRLKMIDKITIPNTDKEKTNTKMRTGKTDIKENINDDVNISKIDADVKKIKTEFDKKNKDLNVKENINDIRKESEKIDLKENVIDKKDVLLSDIKMKKDKVEKINARKKKPKEVEIKENSINDIDITKNDKIANKDETEFKKDKDSNMEEKTDNTKKKVKKSKMKEKAFDNMSNKDNDVKEIKNEVLNTKEEKNDAILDKTVAILNEIDHARINKTDEVENNIEQIESLQFEQNNDLDIKSYADSPGTSPDNFEIIKQKKKMKRRQKKNKSEIFPTNSIINSDVKPEQVVREIEITEQKQYHHISYKENEILSLRNEISVKYSVENVYKRPRQNLSKSHRSDKYVEKQEYQHSYKIFNETQFLEKFNADMKEENQKRSLNTCEKRDDTYRKQMSAKKTYSSKNMIEKVEKCSATSSSKNQRSITKTYSPKSVIKNVESTQAPSSSEKQRSRKTYLPKSMIEKVKLSPAPPSSENIEDDGSYDLEPGEVPLFKKDYKKVLDKQSPNYSVSSFGTVFNNDDEEDLEEGEVDPNNPDFNCDLKSRRFKNLRSWWKRRKKSLTKCFTSCFCTRGLK